MFPRYGPDGAEFSYPAEALIEIRDDHYDLSLSAVQIAIGMMSSQDYVGKAYLVAPRVYRMPERSWRLPMGDWRRVDGVLTLIGIAMIPRSRWFEKDR